VIKRRGKCRIKAIFFCQKIGNYSCHFSVIIVVSTHVSSKGESVVVMHGVKDGCSGYVMFTHKILKLVTIAFSNPSVGDNKIGIKVGSAHNAWDVWNEMGKHYSDNSEVTCAGTLCGFSNTGGAINDAHVYFQDL
jgi:hypothetical protein